MAAIILGGNRSEHFFGEDLGLDRETSGRVTVAIRRFVKDSFADLRMATDANVRERSQICQRWFREMHGGLGWSVARCLGQDGVPLALACEVAGLSFAPAESIDTGYRTYKKGRVPWDRIG